LRAIISIPAVNPCVPLKAQPWGDVIRCAGQQVSFAGVLSEVGKGIGAPVARTVLWSAPPCRTRRAGQGPSSCPTDKVEAARAVGAIPAAESARVAVEGAPVEVVEASPAVAAQHTLAVVVEASPVVAPTAVAAVAPVADTTNPPSHCSC
jgi:hypothetical protein